MASIMMQINRDAMFAKLNTLKIIQLDQNTRLIPCSAFIDMVSSATSRDKRIISDFTESEMILYDRKRHFTHAGILKFMNVGHFINYINTCEWLKITPDPHYTYNKELKKMLRDNLYVTASLCKFLFSKRKGITSLSPLCTLQEFLNALTVQTQQQATRDKLEFLKFKASHTHNIH
jgi:hypothetical protein